VASGLAKAATLALLNLSLVLALGSLAATAIGAPALPTAVVAAFIASTLGGLIVALVVRAPAEISGAATSVTIIYAALAADLVSHAGHGATVSDVWAGLAIAVILAGVFVTIAGYAGLAGAIKFMPAPVTAGFVTGLGLGVVWSQLGPLLGLEGRLSSHSWSEVLEQTKPASIAIGAVTAFVMWVSPKLWARAQPTLVALAAGTVLYYVTGWVFGPHVLGRTLGRIAPFATAQDTVSTLWSRLDPASALSIAGHVAPYAAFLALQIVMNGAVTAASVGALRGTRSDVNRMLRMQGLTNLLCGTLGSLPVTSVASISIPAARMQGVTPLTAAASCVMLFAAVLVAGDLLAGIPVAVLSGILIMNGVAMIDRWAIGLLGRLRKPDVRSLQVLWNLAIVAAVAAAFNFGSVPLALFVGAILAMVLLALSLSEATTFDSADAIGLASTRVWSDEQAQWLAGERRRIAVFRPRGSLFFGTADELAAQLEGIGRAVQFVVLDLARVTTVDATACQIIAAAAKKLDGRRVRVLLAGVVARSARGEELAALGLTYPDREAQWFVDLDHALERVELALLVERWSSADMREVDLAQTTLTKGLTQADVAALRAYMTVVEVPAGPLFKRGDPGNSMFVVASGFVEIRIGGERAPNAMRLAAFGPGSVFGEIAMLNSEERTADAVCLEPSRLYELTRERLAELEKSSPALYTRLMENLNRHLAARLIVATSTVQAHR
jgi:MFS superfamily sulfate permease-like transporter/CRP-like cAMP-binding protein